MTQRAYKYRFYPTDEQAQQLARTFGCVRYVYNWGLRLKTDAYYKDGKRLYYADLSKQLTVLKQQPETVWLNEVSSVALQQSLAHLDKAFLNFFEGRAKYPDFHKKHARQSASFMTSAFKWDGQNVTLAKMKEPLDIRWSRHVSGAPSSVTVSRDAANRYHISILVDEVTAPLPEVMAQIGLDLGLTDAVILSTGEKIGNPRFFRRNEKRLAMAQRRLAKKQQGSRNRIKGRLKVARIHARIADRRNDFTHKLTTRLVHENQVIAVESLQVKNMTHNHSLAKSIADVGWSEMVRQLEYKAAWYGRTLVKIDKFYPSSKRCYDCGHIMQKLPLDVRKWTCPECGEVHDRDVNAAQNVLAAGLAVLACGEAVRPRRKLQSKRQGKPQRSRKTE
ncbi:MAG: RNA-guided endonuclease TnpB family protein [Bacilli bacterium]